MVDPKVTALVTCYNKARTIKACISAILGSNLIEKVIIFDDSSQDSSLEILNKAFSDDLRVQIISSNRNIGVARARNQLLAQTQSEVICLIDGDDIIDPLEKDEQIRYLLENLNIKFSYSGYCRKTKRGVIDVSPEKFSYSKLQRYNYIPFSSVVLRKALDISFERVHHEDYLCWLNNLKLVGRESVYIHSKPTFTYADDGFGLSRNILKGFIAGQIIKKMAGIGLLDIAVSQFSYAFHALKKRVIRK